MPLENNATLLETIQAQNEFIAEQTQKIATLETNNATALQNLSALGQRVYGYNHESFAVKDIETVYYDIIAANPELESKHAIGFTALLKDGETVSKQGNIMYINGEEETEDYTFSGTNTSDSNEFVIVWYFSNNGYLNFAASYLSILKLAVIQNDSDISLLNFETGYYEQIETLIGHDFYFPSSASAKKLEINTLNNHSLQAGSIQINSGNKYFKSNAKKMSHTSGGPFTSSVLTNMKILDFPELEEIYSESHGGVGTTFDFNSTINAQIKMPKLKTINSPRALLMFNNVATLELPETLTTITIGTANFAFIKSVRNKLTLNCIHLESMPNGWYSGTAPSELEIKTGWSGTIDLSVAGANMNEKSWWVDLFENKLCNIITDVRTLKIPSAIYDELTDEDFEIAEDKGWTIGC